MAHYSLTIFYTQFSNQLTDFQYSNLAAKLSNDQQERNQRFVRWQDRQLHLWGKILLRIGLEKEGIGEDCLDEIQYNQFNRPYINDEIDFNVSHSGNCVVCAIGRGLKLGVDIEKVQDIEFNDFRRVMSWDQWQEIERDENPGRTFFKYWTIKESVIKADGRGLSIPLQNLHIKHNQIAYENAVWYLHQLDLDSEYCACLATNVQDVDISYHYVDFNS